MIALVALSLALVHPIGPLRAAEPEAPQFANPQERLPRPDLSALARLRFLTTSDFPPFNSLDENGRPWGFNIDIAREICAELGISAKCDVQAVPWNELHQALEKGEGEAVVAGVGVSAQSRKLYAFTQPYLRLPGRFVSLRSAATSESIAPVAGSGTVGVLAGSAHERFLRENFRNASIKSFAELEPMLADLQAGQIRTVFGDGMRLSFWLNGEDGACCRFAGGPYWAPDYFGSGLAIAVNPGNARLLEALNFALHEIAVKKRVAALSLRWFPVSFF